MPDRRVVLSLAILCVLADAMIATASTAQQQDEVFAASSAPIWNVSFEPGQAANDTALGAASFANLFEPEPEAEAERVLLSQAVAGAQAPPPEPQHSGFGALVHSTASDFVAFPKRESTWVILGIGAGAAAIAYPFDDEINDALQDSDTLAKVFKPGKYLGYGWVQGGVAAGLYVVGRYVMKPENGVRTNKVSHLGFDLLRANLLTQAFTYGLKYAVQRNRPTGECCSFPSGHASVTFATAAVIERHFGYRASWPMFAIAGYVAASRLTENRHFLSDVLFGSALGMAAGWTVVGRHGRDNFTLFPMPVRGGVVLAGSWTPTKRQREAD